MVMIPICLSSDCPAWLRVAKRDRSVSSTMETAIEKHVLNVVDKA